MRVMNIKKHQIVYYKSVNFMVHELYLNFLKRGKTGVKTLFILSLKNVFNIIFITEKNIILKMF